MQDEEFLQEAVKRGYLTPVQVEQARKTQAEVSARGLKMELSQILVMKGLLNVSQVETIKGAGGPKQLQFGEYKIQSKIGEGGMGIVYKATKGNDTKLVALKILNTVRAADQEQNARIEREAKILVQMNHPNLVKGYEYGTINGRFYISMEYLEGNLLNHLLKSRGPQEESLVIDIGIAIAGALEFMQQQGLVHRDIKPDNIMLCNDGSIKLMDLGLAKATTGEITSLTAPGMAIGTPVYMSPEHIKGARNLDIRTDIYGLGATMYHAITGQKPFEGDNPFQIMYKKTEQPPPNPKGRRKDMSENLATIIQICMAREKEDRYANPKELVADLNLIKQGHAPRKRLPGAPAPAPVSATSPQPKAPTGSVRAAGATPLPARKKSPAGMIMAVIVILLLLAAGAIAYVKFVKKGRIPGLGHRISVPS